MNIRLLLPILVCICTFHSFSCNLKYRIDYCEILEKDQSNLFSQERTQEENAIALEKRKQIFLENFDVIIKEVMRKGFPHLNEESKKLDSCIYDAILATLIHISQTRPDLFYSPEITDLFLKEIQANRLTTDLLYTPVKMGAFNTVCDTLKTRIETAIKLWGVKEELLQNFKYKNCE